MTRFTIFPLAACFALALLVGCERKPAETQTTEKPPTPTAPVENGVPASLFVAEAPADAVPLIDAKTSASQGDRVVFSARVGGRVEPFVENRAMFFVADPSLLSCDQLHGDACKYPWDYCCESPANLIKHMATIQVVGEDGRPLKFSLQNEHGLEPLKTIYVTGTVHQIDDAGNFVVNADSIHIAEG